MISKKLVALFRLRDYQNTLRVASLEHASQTRKDRESVQLERFNRVWIDARENVPFYASWQKLNDLPDQISSLDELEKWPIITKRELQRDAALLIRPGKSPDSLGMTGGSTGEPLRFGHWKENSGDSTPNMWIGRAAYGIEPGDRTCLLWGHRHLYGKGVKRSFNIVSRTIKDALMNVYRISAYDLSPNAMRDAMKKMKAFSPVFVIGFSPAVLAFCRTNRIDEHSADHLNVKSVLCTAGPLTRSEIDEISTFFDAPVCMEYGAAECGVMAHTVPSGGYRTFWQTHLLQTVPDEQNAYRNIVTTLNERYFPLIRYDIGDYLELYPDEIERPHRFISVIGRPSDIVRFADGTAFFGALIGDCVKQIPIVTANQTIIRNDAMIIHVLADRPITPEQKDLIVRRCRVVVPALSTKRIEVEQREQLKTGVSGKVQLVVYE